ncbi:hypothetical protein [Rhodovulum sp. 12E13]|uniref:hypothetical protein n=1 Tax=Rhodovulum sp. 12E13 TaxID=2203891 RepID=UPI001314FCAD|nr:hypothetical protein [Rhodovulum sp. 12E13]
MHRITARSITWGRKGVNGDWFGCPFTRPNLAKLAILAVNEENKFLANVLIRDAVA